VAVLRHGTAVADDEVFEYLFYLPVCANPVEVAVRGGIREIHRILAVTIDPPIVTSSFQRGGEGKPTFLLGGHPRKQGEMLTLRVLAL
jgi:hypothetical protein